MSDRKKNFDGSIALVTGAAGFIGGHVARVLRDRGAIVHCTSRQARDDGRWHAIDLADRTAVNELINAVQPDFVFHLASHVTGAREIEHVLPTFNSNLASTVNLLSAISGTKCQRLVLAGSLEEPDVNDDAPSSPYAASKAAAAIYAKMFHRVYGTPITIARLFMVYGPNQPDTRKLVPYVTLSLLKGDTPELTSGVRPVDWVHVDDVAETIVASAIAPDLIGKTIDIGTGRLATVRSIAERIGKLVGRGTPVFGAVEDRAQEQVRAADPTLAESLLGRRMIDVDEGLENTVAWYREHSNEAGD